MFRLIVLVIAISTCSAFPRALNPKFGGIDVKIVGGNETTIEEHPWQVSLRDNYLGHYCGGSLISKDTVLTAASCLDGIEFDDRVLVGTSSQSSGGIEYDIASFVVHENFSSYTMNLDIGIIKLKGEVEFSDSVQVVNLPKLGETLPDGTKVIASGWGMEEETDEHYPDILREVTVKMISKHVCEAIYSGLTEYMICAGGASREGTCERDEGGPLTLNRTLYGIISWGQGCAEPDHPGVYTNVANLRGWIKEHSGV